MNRAPQPHSRPGTRLDLSVIIPVWNGEREIGGLLDCLAAQNAPRDRYEVIVVDNGSTDRTRDVVSLYDFVKLVSETRPGSYAARNKAIAMARGDHLLFTDADCMPDGNWIAAALARVSANIEPALVGGRIELFRTEDAGAYGARYDELVAGFNQEWNLAHRICVTANWLAPKAVMERVGLFNASLLSGGDGECAARIADAGFPLVYAPEMLVRHPARANLAALIRKKRRVTGGRWQKNTGPPSLMHFSRNNLQEYLNQARWMKNSAIPARYKPGVLAIVGTLWLVTQLELVRLAVGGRPYRG